MRLGLGLGLRATFVSMLRLNLGGVHSGHSVAIQEARIQVCALALNEESARACFAVTEHHLDHDPAEHAR